MSETPSTMAQSTLAEETSFALVTRLARFEAPFLNEFLAYYQDLGVDAFYLINTEPEYRHLIADVVLPQFRRAVTIVDKPHEHSLGSCPNAALPHIKETFLVHLDLDEFLYLGGLKLREFAEKEGLREAQFTECKFRWVMSPLCRDLYAPSIREIVSRQYGFLPRKGSKCLARTKEVETILTHKFVLKDEKRIRAYDRIDTNCFVVHVSVRGIMDTMNKVNWSQFENVKRSDNPRGELHELIFDPTSSSLPGRFRLLAFQDRLAKPIKELRLEYPDLDCGIDVPRLRAMTLEGLESTLGVEVTEEDLKALVKKIDRYEIPAYLIDSYLAGKSSLVKVARLLEAGRFVNWRSRLSRVLRKAFRG